MDDAVRESSAEAREISREVGEEIEIEKVETLILGAGPAGLQMGYYLERAGREYLILEAGEGPGTFFRNHPRHRKLISINKVHTGYDDPEINLRWDWNSLLSDSEDLRFANYSRRYFPPADTLVEYLEDFAEHHRLRVRTGARATRISRQRSADGEPGPFRVEDARGRVLSCRRLIVATGIGVPYMPPIPGIELTENYADAPLAPEAYEGQHILILGKGNSAFETADHLIETAAVIHVVSPSSIHFAWQTHHVGHLRALNNNFLDTYQLKSQNAVLDAEVEAIERRPDGRFAVALAYSHASGERETLTYDRVINCTGFRFDVSPFAPECRPELVIADRFPRLTSTWESTNVPDLFFVGALMQSLDFKKTTSSFIHGFRYNIRTLHHFLERRDHGVPLPRRALPATVEALVEATLERVNTSSALWQQFGFLGDVILVDEATGEASYLEELPTAWVRQGELTTEAHLYLVTLEFGPNPVDPFAIERKPSTEHAADSAFLHPVIRRFQYGEELETLHVLEDLYGEWTREEVHVEPVRRFFEAQLEGVGSGRLGAGAELVGSLAASG